MGAVMETLRINSQALGRVMTGDQLYSIQIEDEPPLYVLRLPYFDIMAMLREVRARAEELKGAVLWRVVWGMVWSDVWGMRYGGWGMGRHRS